MNYKLVTSVAAVAMLACSNAFAYGDITAPLYLPEDMETLSNTSVAYERTKFDDDGVKEDLIVRENLMMGIGNNTAVSFTLGNRFNTKWLTNQEYNNEHNFDYEVGVKKNMSLYNDLMMQVGASYYTYSPRSWYGHSSEAKNRIRAEYGNTRWYKELRGEVKLAKELENGLTPYAGFAVNGNIDSSDRDLYYTAMAAVHKNEYNFAFDAGLRYEFQFGDDVNAWFMQASADYFLTDNVTFGAFADYQFADNSDVEVDYGYTTELRFKVLF